MSIETGTVAALFQSARGPIEPMRWEIRPPSGAGSPPSVGHRLWSEIAKGGTTSSGRRRVGAVEQPVRTPMDDGALPMAFDEAELARACAAASASAVSVAEAAMASREAAASEALLRAIATSLDRLVAEQGEREKRSRAHSLAVGLAIGRRLGATAPASGTIKAIEDILAAVGSSADRGQVAEVRVHPELVGELEAHLATLPGARTMHVLPDPSLEPGDLRLALGETWAERRVGQIEQDIVQILATGLAPEPSPSQAPATSTLPEFPAAVPAAGSHGD